MKCPGCKRSQNVGIIASYKFRKGHTTTYFCNSCCLEFQVRGDKIVATYFITPEGELKKVQAL
ncbi:MAG TPA: hypothetical protein PKI30_03375 [Bacillota bacterium]|jgi:transposase-like protein|nr:hypothetical protein [Bacillota bacterium]